LVNRSVDVTPAEEEQPMITVEDLRNSLRLQLGALVELYERDSGRARPPRRTGRAVARVQPSPPGSAERAEAEAGAGQAARIESCLVDFDAALRAASRADAMRETAQRAALAALERSVAMQRHAAAARQTVRRVLVAAGDHVDTPRLGRHGAVSVERVRADARAADVTARKADMQARRCRNTAELTARLAMSALLAAIQADPSRGNPGFDADVAGAARRMAERAAREAIAAVETGLDASETGGVVVRLTPGRQGPDSRTAGDPEGS
jgi:hypothetical protein